MKKHFGKRILALMLAVVMMFGMFPINAKADGETPETCEYCSVELTEGAEHAAHTLEAGLFGDFADGQLGMGLAHRLRLIRRARRDL